MRCENLWDDWNIGKIIKQNNFPQADWHHIEVILYSNLLNVTPSALGHRFILGTSGQSLHPVVVIHMWSIVPVSNTGTCIFYASRLKWDQSCHCNNKTRLSKTEMRFPTAIWLIPQLPQCPLNPVQLNCRILSKMLNLTKLSLSYLAKDHHCHLHRTWAGTA